MRKLAINISLIVAGVAVALILAEIALRFTRPSLGATDTKIDTPRTQAPPSSPGWPLFRGHGGDDFVVTPKQDARRIVIVGDSFTWGDGVEADEAYPVVLENMLRERRGEEAIEVTSWSRPGWNTWREWKSLQPQLPMLDPDLLIIGYCINDAEPLNRRQLMELRKVMRTAQHEPSSPFVTWSYNHTQLGALLYNFFENRRVRKTVTAYYQTLYDEGRSGWVRAQDALVLFSKLAKQQSFPVLLVVFPIFDSELDYHYGYRNLHPVIEAAATRAGIEVLDLLPAYEGFDGRDLAVVPFSNAHPSPLAHRVAAEQILIRLEDLSTKHELW